MHFFNLVHVQQGSTKLKNCQRQAWFSDPQKKVGQKSRTAMADLHLHMVKAFIDFSGYIIS